MLSSIIYIYIYIYVYIYICIYNYVNCLFDYLNNISLQQEYLKTMISLQQSHMLPPACSDEPPRVRQEEDDEKKTLIVLYHDELTQTRVKHGCGERKTNQHFSSKRKGVASWCLTL